MVLDELEHDFSAWLLKLNGLRAEMSDEDIKDAALAGGREGAAAGSDMLCRHRTDGFCHFTP